MWSRASLRWLVRALVFDFDGTLFDTHEQTYLAMRDAFGHYGATIGIRDAVTLWDNRLDWHVRLETLTGRRVDRDAFLSRFAGLRDDRMSVLGPRPGADTLVRAARQGGVLVGMATGSPRRWIDPLLDRNGLLGAFDAIACGEDVEENKPAPDVYHHVLRALVVEPREAIALEDSPAGIEAAQRAGLFCVVVRHSISAHWDLSAADLIIDRFADLTVTSLRGLLATHRLDR